MVEEGRGGGGGQLRLLAGLQQGEIVQRGPDIVHLPAPRPVPRPALRPAPRPGVVMRRLAIDWTGSVETGPVS